MTDQRLAVLEKELIRTPLQPGQQKSIELLQALKAERERIAELNGSLEEWQLDFGELEARLGAVEAAYKDIRWVSSDKDNMEFTATITCWQHDRIKALEQK